MVYFMDVYVFGIMMIFDDVYCFVMGEVILYFLGFEMQFLCFLDFYGVIDYVMFLGFVCVVGDMFMEFLKDLVVRLIYDLNVFDNKGW